MKTQAELINEVNSSSTRAKSVKLHNKFTAVDGIIKKVTEKAVLIDFSFDYDRGNDERWIPLSLIIGAKETSEGSTIFLPFWFARKEFNMDFDCAAQFADDDENPFTEETAKNIDVLGWIKSNWGF